MLVSKFNCMCPDCGEGNRSLGTALNVVGGLRPLDLKITSFIDCKFNVGIKVLKGLLNLDFNAFGFNTRVRFMDLERRIKEVTIEGFQKTARIS